MCIIKFEDKGYFIAAFMACGYGAAVYSEGI